MKTARIMTALSVVVSVIASVSSPGDVPPGEGLVGLEK